MAHVPLDPSPGLNSDDTTFSKQGRWADGNNVRWRLGRPQVIGGWAFGTSLVSGLQCRGLFIHKTVSATDFYYGMTSKLYCNQDPVSGASDITPANFGAISAPWSFAAWGSQILFSRSGGGLYEYTRGSAAGTPIAQAPLAINAMLVHRRQVIAFGCNEEGSGTFNGRCIRWSDIEDHTDWATAPDSNAGEHIIDSPGEIVAAAEVGDSIAFWTVSSLWLMHFIGDPGETYRLQKIADGCGLVHKDALVVLDNGAAYWIGTDLHPRSWTPGGQVERIACPIYRDFAENAVGAQSLGTGIGAVAVNRYKEIWWFYRDRRDAATRRNRYIAFNTEEGTWFRGQMTRTAAIDSGLLAAPFSGTYDSGAFIAVDLLQVYIQETGNTAAGSAMSWHIQSADQALDNGQRRMMIRGFIPDFEDQVGDVALTLSVRDRPQSAATTKGPYTLTTSTTKKDFRASGKLVSVKFSGGSAGGSYMRLGKPLFDVVPTGER